MYQKLGLPTYTGYHTTLQGISGQTLKLCGVTTALFELSEQKTLTHKVVVLPDSYLKTEVLLGMDLLSRNGKTTVDPGSNRVKWGRYKFDYYNLPSEPGLKGVKPVVKVDAVNMVRSVRKEDSEKKRLHVSEKFRLPARQFSVQEIKVSEAAGKCIVIDLTHEELKTPLPVYCKVNAQGFCKLLLKNETKKHIRFKAGAVLGTMEIVDKDNVDVNIPYVNVDREEEVVPPTVNQICTSHHPLLDYVNDGEIQCLSVNCIRQESKTVNSLNTVNTPRITNAMLPDIKMLSENLSRKDKLHKLVNQQNLEHLTREQRKKLKTLLSKQEDLFILDHTDIGTLQVPPQEIFLADPTPVRGPQYRHPEKAREIIKTMLEEMKDKDIIENSSAAWLSPIVLVSKPDGTKRLCLDYRAVNKQLKTDIHPLPRLDELVESTAGQEYYCTLDLKDAYYQLMLKEESRDITTFSDGCNLWRFKRLPFGLTVSPAIFTRAINQIIAPLASQGFVRNYLDDVIVYAASYEQLMENLEKVFNRFTTMGVKLNIAKCKFAHQSVKFLGHIISSEGIKPDPENVEGIMNMPAPKNLKETRRFLGMTGFYRKCIERYAHIAAPLTQLTRKDVDFSWTNDCQEAFDNLKLRLSTAPVLHKADLNLPYELHTDASGIAVGAALHQRHSDGKLYPIGFYSKKFRPVELRYSVTDKEALGVILSCRFFHHFLWGSKVEIKTDHKGLVSVFKRKTKSPRMTRWSLEMREYDFTITYQEGRANVVADQLSRCVRQVRIEPPDVQLDEQVAKLHSSCSEIAEEQDKEERWRHLKEYLKGGPIPKYIYAKAMVSQFEVKDEILYYVRKLTDGTLKYCLVIPQGLKKAALHASHDGQTAGHMGQYKTISRAEADFYWPGYRQDCVEYVKSCSLCQQYKSAASLQRKWQGLSEVTKPLQRVGIDLTDMHAGLHSYRYVLTIIDHYSRFVTFYKLKTKSASEVSKNFLDFITTYGAPRSVIADNGGEFTAHQFKELCESYSIKLSYTTPYHPRGNSITERLHRSFKTCLAMMTQGYPNRWTEYLKFAQYALNTSVHTAIGVQPHFAFFSRHVARPFSAAWPVIENDSVEGVGAAHELIRRTNAKMSEQFRDYANKGRKEEKVNVNDLVYVQVEKTIPGTARKLNPKWYGPYTVIKVFRDGGAYLLQNPFDEDNVIKRAAEKVKRCVERDRLIEESESKYGEKSDDVVDDLEMDQDMLMDNTCKNSGANPVPDVVSSPQGDTVSENLSTKISQESKCTNADVQSKESLAMDDISSGRRYPARQRRPVDKLTYY